MRRHGRSRELAVAGLAALTLVGFSAPGAWAEPSTYCVKATRVLTPKKHYTGGWTNTSCSAGSPTHEGKYEKITPSAFSEGEQNELKALLKYVKVQASGVGGEPTVQFSHANVQVVNGEGSTATKNGAGNLVLGYDEHAASREQTGSHDLVLGDQQTFSSYAGIVAGEFNAITAPYASVSGGLNNTASQVYATVSGGGVNTASGGGTSVSGGFGNTATGNNYSWVGGGWENLAEGNLVSIFGGRRLTVKSESEACGGYPTITC